MNILKSFHQLFSSSPEQVIAREHLQTQLSLIEHTKNLQYYQATTEMLKKRLTELDKMARQINQSKDQS